MTSSKEVPMAVEMSDRDSAYTTRRALAVDHVNLLAVSVDSLGAKGDKLSW